MLGNLYNTFLYQPLFNALIWIYHVLPWHDLGVAIILLTLFIKLLLFYPSLKGIRAQRSMQDLNPKLEAVKKEYADDKEELGRQIMALYKEHKVSPVSSCLPLLIQLPILIALFHVFQAGLKIDATTGLLVPDSVSHLYGFLRDTYTTTALNKDFLGFMDLTATHNIVLAVAAGLAQFFQTKMMQSKRPVVKSEGSKDEDMTAIMNKQMMYVLPVMTVIFGYQFPSGVTLYWLASTLFTWIQQLFFLRDHKKTESEKDSKTEVVSVQ